MVSSTEITVIHLTYHPDNKGGYTITSDPSNIHLKPGQRVKFDATVSADSGYEEPRIRIVLEPPSRFQPSVFFTGDDAVVVQEAAQAAAHGAYAGSSRNSSSMDTKGMLRCGLVDDEGNLIAPETGHGVDL